MPMRANDLYRMAVHGPGGKRLGRVGDVLFHPSEPRVVGYVVERSRLLYLFDRKDRYLAADAATVSREAVGVRDRDAAWDRQAAARLGFSWDETVIWSGMPVRTTSGVDAGTVRDVRFEPASGALVGLDLGSGAAADAAVGIRELSADMVKGFSDGAVSVIDEAVALETTGGAAAVAGKTAVVASKQVREAASAAADGIQKAARYGGAAAKVAAQSKTGKKAVGWLKSVRDEIVDAMGDPDDDE